MDAASDEVRVTAADVQVTGQIRSAVGGSRVRVWIRGWRPVHLISYDVGRRVFLSLLELDVGELGDADGTHYRPSLCGVGVRRGTVEAVVEVERVLTRPVLADLGLTVHQRIGAAVSVRVADVEIAHRMALALGGWHHSEVLLPHDGLVVGRGAVGGRNQGAVAVRGHVVGPHEITSCDAGVGGHGRRLQVVLGVVKGAGALSAVHAAVTDPSVILVWRAIETGLRMIVESILIVDVKIICGKSKKHWL